MHPHWGGPRQQQQTPSRRRGSSLEARQIILIQTIMLNRLAHSGLTIFQRYLRQMIIVNSPFCLKLVCWYLFTRKGFSENWWQIATPLTFLYGKAWLCKVWFWQPYSNVNHRIFRQAHTPPWRARPAPTSALAPAHHPPPLPRLGPRACFRREPRASSGCQDTSACYMMNRTKIYVYAYIYVYPWE